MNYGKEHAIREKHLVDNRNRVEEVEKSRKKSPSKPETVKQITAEKQASKAKRNNEEELRKNVEQL